MDMIQQLLSRTSKDVNYTIMIKKKETYQNKVFKFPGFMILLQAKAKTSSLVIHDHG